MNILRTTLPSFTTCAIPTWRLGALFALLLAALILYPPQFAQAQSPPATPGTITVSRSDGALHAFWNSVGGATSYHVTYSSDNGASWSLAALNHGFYYWNSTDSGSEVKQPSNNGWTFDNSTKYENGTWSEATDHRKYKVTAVPK